MRRSEDAYSVVPKLSARVLRSRLTILVQMKKIFFLNIEIVLQLSFLGYFYIILIIFLERNVLNVGKFMNKLL